MNYRKKLTIIRHGETDYNRMNIVQGSGVDTDLNETGRLQAHAFFAHYGNEAYDHIYMSALKRTHQSVAPFIDAGFPHSTLGELNEISWGDFEGREQTEAQRNQYLDMVARWKAGDVHAKISNGESPHELQARQQRAVHHIMQQPSQTNVLICMHGRAMKSLLCLLLNKPLSQMDDFEHRNLCVYELGYDGESFSLLRHNDTTHLAALQQPA